MERKTRIRKSKKIVHLAGIFSVLANNTIDKNGVVYGAAFDENLQVSHIRITSKEEILKLQGSKYIQSNTGKTFSQVKEDAEKGIKVLYVGTPCQIAGLRNYLDKDYANLLLVDLVCHGVPSQKIFNKYIDYVQKKNKSNVTKYYFRSKEKGTWGLNLEINFENKKVKSIPSYLDPYYVAFLNGNIYRECCYSCKYANSNRVGDITLADFWGIEKEYPKFYDAMGVSAIIINTEKGKSYFDEVKKKIDYIDSPIDKIKKENRNLSLPTSRPIIRNGIYINIDEKSAIQYVKENLKYKKNAKDIVKGLIPYGIKKKYKQIKMKSIKNK